MILPNPAAMAVPFIALDAALHSHQRNATIGFKCFLLVDEAGAADRGFSAHLQGGIALVLAAFFFTALFRRIGVAP